MISSRRRLLRRAGWEVWMAPDIGGSFEEPPPTLIDYLMRDRRWCQGNLQHLRVVFAQGLTLPSRLHLAMGIMSYLSSPLWLLLLVVSAFDMLRLPAAARQLCRACSRRCRWWSRMPRSWWCWCWPPWCCFMVPSCWRSGALLEDVPATRAHGGTGAVIGERAVRKALFSTLMAPIVMLQHSWYVLTIVMGMATGWNARPAPTAPCRWVWSRAKFAPHTLIGAVAAFVFWQLCAGHFDWFVPLLAGLLAVHPAGGAVSSSPLLGRLARRRPLFLVPSRDLGLQGPGPRPCPGCRPMRKCRPTQRLVLEDAAVRELHLALLTGAPAPADPLRVWSAAGEAAPPRHLPASAAKTGRCCCRIRRV